MNQKKTSLIKYISGLLLFGLNGVIADKILLPSYEIVFLRTLIGSLFLIAVFYLGGHRLALKKDNKKEVLFVLLSGVSMGASWIVLYEAYQRIGVGMSSIAYYCGPVIVMILAPVLFRQKTTRLQKICFCIVLTGIFLANLSDLDRQIDGFGLICGLLSAIFHALMVIFTMKAPSITGNKNSMMQLTVSFLTVAVFVCCGHSLSLPQTSMEWGWILFLGLINTGIGCYLYFSSIAFLPVQSISILGYLEPLSSVIFALLLIHEPMSFLQLTGAFLILAGSVLSEISGSTAASTS